MTKIKVKMNKPVYLGLPILEISKTHFINNIKTEDFCEDIANDVEKRYDRKE